MNQSVLILSMDELATISKALGDLSMNSPTLQEIQCAQEILKKIIDAHMTQFIALQAARKKNENV